MFTHLSHISIGLTELLAVIGTLTGTAGLAIGLLNYSRDNPKVRVILRWDLRIVGGLMPNPGKLHFEIQVANIGRRPIYLRAASLKLPKGYRWEYVTLREGLDGEKLSEGDPPKIFTSDQDDLGQYAKDWRKIRAVVWDSASKKYFSERPKWNAKPPSWAN